MIEAGQEVVSHNIETVERLYRKVRPQANYERSLEQIKKTKDCGKRTKSGIMVGLGEKKEEVFKTMDDMVKSGLHILTIGQYLQPTKMHLEVDDFISPEVFEMYKEKTYTCTDGLTGVRGAVAGALDGHLLVSDPPTDGRYEPGKHRMDAAGRSPAP